MSGDDTTDYELSRRTFAKAAGAAAGGGLLGASMGSAAAADDSFETSFANVRVQEARKVWDRGFRGRHDRTLGLTDSGLDARHPDLGPWNGVQAIDDGGTFRLVDPEESKMMRSQVYGSDPDMEATATVEPGAFPAGSEKVLHTFDVSGTSYDTANNYAKDTMYPMYDLLLEAELSWSPNANAANDLEFRLDRQAEDGTWTTVARTATGSMPEQLNGVELQPDSSYRLVAECYVNTVTQATVTANFAKIRASYEEVGSVFDRGAADGSNATPKCVGWADPDSRFGSLDKPRDPNGHGTHCASIMGGSGRASAVHSLVEQDDNMSTVLIPGDTLEYEVSVDPTNGEGGVFVSAYGDNLELAIEGPDGREVGSSIIASDTSALDNNVAEAPADSAGTYTVYVRPADVHAQGETVGATLSTGRVSAVSVGRLADPSTLESDRDEGEVSLHSGMAPNAGLVGLQGFSAPVAMLATHGESFTDSFNLRSVNMSWGYTGGLPLGGLGQGLDNGVVANIKTMAESGILSVAAAGNAATPANGNGAPAVADEAISVVATGPRDGISGYSSGGIGANDEDGDGTYMKPDVTAPGGTLTDLAFAAKADTDTSNFDTDTGPRDYTGKAGTSMASPYTNGTAGLVAEAMEFGAETPEEISLPEPTDTGFEDVMRLKSVLLSTATQTAFTAAPYHRAKAPVYQHGERDPFEGYGRINPDAAVDAVTRPFMTGLYDLDPKETASDSADATLGLDVPTDSRAVAGFVEAPEGTLDVSLSFSHFSGGNKGMAKGSPWVDLFVYDATSPAANGEPNAVASVEGRQGSGSVSVDVGDGGGVYYVVAKLVNVPGAVNGYDIQANMNLSFDFERAAFPTFTASGRRTDDSTQYTAGQAAEVRVEIDSLSEVDSAEIRDRVPSEWTVKTVFSDDVVGTTTAENGDTLVHFGSVDAAKLSASDSGDEHGDDPGEFSYLVEAPEAAGDYTFGPAAAVIEDPKDKSVSNTQATFGGTETNIVLSTSTGSESPTDTITDGVEDGTDTVTEGTDTVTGGSDGGSTVGDAVDETTSTVTETTESTTSTLTDSL
jgi:subtilisin family serine protease